MSRVVGVALVILALGAYALLGGWWDDAPADPGGSDGLGADAPPGPALTTTTRPQTVEAPGTREGAALLKRLRELDAAGWERMKKELAADGYPEPPVTYDAALVAFLMERLVVPGGAETRVARVVLGRMGPRIASELYVVFDENDIERKMAVLSLVSQWCYEKLDPPDPGWVRLLEDTDARLRGYAWTVAASNAPYSESLAAWCLDRVAFTKSFPTPASALARMGPRALAQLFDRLEKPVGEGEVEAILQGLHFAPPEALTSFLDRLGPFIRSRNETIQLHAIQALRPRQVDCTACIGALIDAWPHAPGKIRSKILHHWFAMGEDARAAAPLLWKALAETNDDKVARWSLLALAEMRADPDRVLPLLRDKLSEDGEEIEGAAIAAYGAAALPYLRQLLEGSDPDARFFALSGVSRLGANAKSLVPRLVDLIESDDEGVASRAAMAAGAIGDAAAEAIPSIWRRLESGTFDTGRSKVNPINVVGGAFFNMGESARPFLLEKLRSGDGRGSLLALKVLGAMGGQARFALDDMARFLDARRDELRRHAVISVRAALSVAPSSGDIDPTLSSEMRERVRALFTPLENDTDRITRGVVQSTLLMLDQVPAPR